MSRVTLNRLAELYPKESEREAIAPWLLAFDENQDGALEKSEVQDSKGYFRCDWLSEPMSVRRWKNFQTILQESGLVEKKRPTACGVLVERNPPPPLLPQGRYPAEYQVLFFSQNYDWSFAFTAKATPLKLLIALGTSMAKVERNKQDLDVTLNSGNLIRFELGPSNSLSKIHYLDAKGDYALLARLEFLQIIRDSGQFEDFFSKNPYFAEEQAAWVRLYSPIFTAPETPVYSLIEAKEKCWKGILLFPDLHGNKDRYREVHRMLKEETLDWFALEMVSHKLQPALDDFISAPEDSDKFREAKEKLRNHLQPFWAPYFKDVKDLEDNPYYHLLLLCRKRGIRAVGMDGTASYAATGQRMMTLTLATRNAIWAKYIPEEGKGIVYGGQFHFTKFPKARVQDFIWEKNPDRTIHLVDFNAKNVNSDPPKAGL